MRGLTQEIYSVRVMEARNPKSEVSKIKDQRTKINRASIC